MLRIFVLGALALVAFHISGLFVLPLAISIPAAALTSEVLRQSAQTH